MFRIEWRARENRFADFFWRNLEGDRLEILRNGRDEFKALFGPWVSEGNPLGVQKRPRESLQRAKLMRYSPVDAAV